ncbi:hypothetical protein EKH55_5551 [Sinorhizobium alkalisoli]|nr:hypothetical protein EKH55_5551 [Sinorhizobium alkalisoli]
MHSLILHGIGVGCAATEDTTSLMSGEVHGWSGEDGTHDSAADP